MSSPNLTALQDELLAARGVIVPQIEGLHDFASLNIKPETLDKVKSATTDFERRRDLINTAQTALAALDADGYPDVPVRQVIGEVYNDLSENVSTIEAAFKKFAPIDEAVSATIVPGTPEQKP